MDKRVIRGPEPYDMPAETQAAVEAMTRQADSDVEELRVNMRWRKAQVDVVKRAAALFGMPYQTYVRQAAVRQAAADLKSLNPHDANPTPRSAKRPARWRAK